MIALHAPSQNHFEVSWALFMAKGLKITLDRDDVQIVCRSESSICALILLDLNSRGQISGAIDISHWLSFRKAETLAKEMWLLVYEGTLKGWLPKTKPCVVETHPLFGELLKRKIQFYDTGRNVRPTRVETRLRARQTRLAAVIFANLDAYF
jgi:hypothetical protein